MVPKEMPTKLLVIGSGAIGIEFASFYRDLGVDVTVFETLNRIVPVEDADVSAHLEKALRKQGMTIVTGAKVGSIAVIESGVRATIIDKNGKAVASDYSHVIVAIGIVPNTGGTGLEELGVAIDDCGFLKVDAMCRPTPRDLGDRRHHCAAVARAQG